ncbi:MAG TPA: spore coat protein [Firmicutes bacterium]|nr:spore coat protein [Candidatus Fermentithermobacillaceae bacterium]
MGVAGRPAGRLDDETVAHDLLSGAKMLSTTAASAIGEAATPQVKEFFSSCLRDATEDHGRIMQLMMSRGWYQPYASPEQQLANDVRKAEQALGGVTETREPGRTF